MVNASVVLKLQSGDPGFESANLGLLWLVLFSIHMDGE